MTLSATTGIEAAAAGWRRPAAGDFVRIFSACVLLLAAGLKGYQLSSEPVLEHDFFSNYRVLAIGVEFEIVLGLWLLSGARTRLSWMAAAAAFAGFSIVSLYKGISGEVSCGCFGSVEISPWYTLIMDSGLLGALVWFRPKSGQSTPPPRFRKVRIATAAVVAGTACLTVGATMAAYSPARLSDDGVIVGDDRFVVLEPDRWVGKPLPLLGHIDAGDRLGRGTWTIILYHHDCPHCRKALPEIRKLAKELSAAAGGGAGRFALVEMPPYAPKDSEAVVSGSNGLSAKLSSERDWFAVTPTLISLKDGRVTAVLEGDIADAPVSSGQDDATASKDSPSFGDAAKVSVSGNKAGHDFGYVKCKDKRAVVFNIPNSSPKPLKLPKVRSECKCMLVPNPPKALAAGGNTPLKVDFIAPDKPMRYSKRVLLQTDSPDRPMVILVIEADVGRPLAVKPTILDMGNVQAGSEVQRPVTLINHGSTPVRLAYSTSTTSECIARIPRAVIEARGGKLSLPIAITPAQSGSKGKATVHIHTDCPTQPQVNVQIKYVVVQAAAKPNPQDRLYAKDTNK